MSHPTDIGRRRPAARGEPVSAAEKASGGRRAPLSNSVESLRLTAFSGIIDGNLQVPGRAPR